MAATSVAGTLAGSSRNGRKSSAKVPRARPSPAGRRGDVRGPQHLREPRHGVGRAAPVPADGVLDRPPDRVRRPGALLLGERALEGEELVPDAGEPAAETLGQGGPAHAPEDLRVAVVRGEGQAERDLAARGEAEPHVPRRVGQQEEVDAVAGPLAREARERVLGLRDELAELGHAVHDHEDGGQDAPGGGGAIVVRQTPGDPLEGRPPVLGLAGDDLEEVGEALGVGLRDDVGHLGGARERQEAARAEVGHVGHDLDGRLGPDDVEQGGGGKRRLARARLAVDHGVALAGQRQREEALLLGGRVVELADDGVELPGPVGVAGVRVARGEGRHRGVGLQGRQPEPPRGPAARGAAELGQRRVELGGPRGGGGAAGRAEASWAPRPSQSSTARSRAGSGAALGA